MCVGNVSIMNTIAHDNTGSNTDGFLLNGSSISVVNSIADTNGRHGFASGTTAHDIYLWQCDAYNNGTDGLKIANTTTSASNYVIRNCNFIKNGGWGVNTALTTGRMWGYMDNCGFGAGTQANGSGTTNNVDALVITGSVTYASNFVPYVDGPNGNFQLVGAALGAGRGTFTTTASSYGPSVGFPDIGAVEAPTPTATPTATATATFTPTATATATFTPTATATATASFTPCAPTPTATATATPTNTPTPTVTPTPCGGQHAFTFEN